MKYFHYVTIVRNIHGAERLEAFKIRSLRKKRIPMPFKRILSLLPSVSLSQIQEVSLEHVKSIIGVWWKVRRPPENVSIPNTDQNTSSVSDGISSASQCSEKAEFISQKDFIKQEEKLFSDQLEKELTPSPAVEKESAESVMTKLFHQSNATENTPQRISRPEIYSKATVKSRTQFLIRSIRHASSNMSIFVKLEEISKHLFQFPESKSIFIKEHSLPFLLNLRDNSRDKVIQSQSREVLALLGYNESIKSQGVRVLSIDGGGTRGVMAIEILKTLENITGCRVHQLFDYVCGVSTGAVLAVLLGALRLPVDQCKEMYLTISKDVFNQSPIWGTGQLVWNHSYYNTDTWVKAVKKAVGNGTLIESVRNADCPKIAVVSTIVNQPLLNAYVFRNYVFPPRVQSQYPGSATQYMWEAVRASAAAPGYFEEFELNGFLHQDGGVLMNNPAALALHECKHLWPDESIQCVVSLGNGRFIPSENSDKGQSSLKKKISKIIDSATDTEGTHIVLHDLLPPNSYFRFNPYLTESLSLDENRDEKMNQLESDAQMYVRRNYTKIVSAANQLMKTRSTVQKTKYWLKKNFSQSF
ncbi:Calcium-independent phospholipase A2-gamma [Nymphon striatum]|nr:Calcium-independent phospholipase A2-gamma [Nymphon striatum]